MFEKESKEYVNKLKPQFKIFEVVSDDVERAYQRGALDVYNKLNNWHNLEENPTDLPKENMKQVIVQDLDGDYYMGWYCVHQNCWYDNECPDTTDYPIKVIKWKEIM